MGKISLKIILILLIIILSGLLTVYLSCIEIFGWIYGIGFILSFLICEWIWHGNITKNKYMGFIVLLGFMQPIIFYPNYFILISPIIFIILFAIFYTNYEKSNPTSIFSFIIPIVIAESLTLNIFPTGGIISELLKSIFISFGLLDCDSGNIWCCLTGSIVFTNNCCLLIFIYLIKLNK